MRASERASANLLGTAEAIEALIYRFISAWKNDRLNDDPYISSDAWRLISRDAAALREINGARMRFLLAQRSPFANFDGHRISDISSRKRAIERYREMADLARSNATWAMVVERFPRYSDN